MQDFEPKRVLSIAIIAAIAFIFAINWGPGSQGCSTGTTTTAASAVAHVNGKEIPVRDFTRAYASRLNMYRQLPESLARQMGVPKQVVEELVNQELWAQAAERHGIATSDQELRDAILKAPAFQKDGKFDRLLYQDFVMSYERKTVPEFETTLRRQMAANKLQQLVAESANVSDDEVKARFIKDGNKAQITYVRFLASMYADKVAAPTAAELAQYKKDHAKEIADFYESNKGVYEQPERVHARHILIKLDRDAPEDKKAEAKKKAAELRKQIVEGGKDFAELAKEVSEDLGSKPSGGDLGLQSRGAWVPEFTNAAFSLKPGEVSEPVETQFGYHLIKVEEKKAAEKKELKDVEDEIAGNLFKQAKAKEMARVDAEKALAAVVKSGKKLAELYPPEKDGQPAVKRFQTENKPEAVQTEEFSSSSDTIPYLGVAAELRTAVFATQAPKLLEQVYPVTEGFAVAAVDMRTLPTDEEFEKQKEKLRTDALRAKQVELRESFIKALKKNGQITVNEEALNEVTRT